MRSMRSMRGGFVFRNQGPSLKVHRGQCLTSMTKHDTGGWPPETACDSDTSASDRPALGYWVKEGVGLVVHFSLEDVAKINTP